MKSIKHLKNEINNLLMEIEVIQNLSLDGIDVKSILIQTEEKLQLIENDIETMAETKASKLRKPDALKS